MELLSGDVKMADEREKNSESGSASEAISEENVDKTPDKRRFALYSYVAHRFQRTGPKNGGSDETKAENVSEMSVADYLQSEAMSDGDFSLTIVSTNLSAEEETGLRKYLAQKISKGTVYSGAGSIVPLDLSVAEDSVAFSCQMYFCLLRHPPSAETTDLSTPTEPSVNSREFVLCFLAPPEDGLELFQKDLDRYSHGLLQLIDAECWETVRSEGKGKLLSYQLTEIDTSIREYLDQWHTVAIQYTCVCVNTLNTGIKYLLYSALTGLRLQLENVDEKPGLNFQRFVDCCSLSELLHASGEKKEPSPTLSDTDALLVDIGETDEMETVQAVTDSKSITLTRKDDSYVCDQTDLPKFCEDWAAALAMGEHHTAASLRRIIESYKLKCIQDMNMLTRLIRLAENDHYALYRAYVFLKTCGNGKILLAFAKQECRVTESIEGTNVLSSLEDYITDTGGFTS